jgi:hypothetical protein
LSTLRGLALFRVYANGFLFLVQIKRLRLQLIELIIKVVSTHLTNIVARTPSFRCKMNDEDCDALQSGSLLIGMGAIGFWPLPRSADVINSVQESREILKAIPFRTLDVTKRLYNQHGLCSTGEIFRASIDSIYYRYDPNNDPAVATLIGSCGVQAPEATRNYSRPNSTGENNPHKRARMSE